MTREAIWLAILAERQAQAKKWNTHHDWGFGDCSNNQVAPITKVAVLSEETGEVARAVLENNNEQLKIELVQVAAVAVAWLESLE